jgi:hypothetical protein
LTTEACSFSTADPILVVTTPDVASMHHARMQLDLLERSGVHLMTSGSSPIELSVRPPSRPEAGIPGKARGREHSQ